MERTCPQCSAAFTITDTDKQFYEMAAPVIGGNKHAFSLPTLCPDCRCQRRLTWRNDRSFYTRTCDSTGETFVSIYPQESPFTVYRPSAWYSDSWDPLSFGREYDFSRPFFDQFRDLMQVVPRLGIDIVNCQNSEYCNYCGDDKNCYLDIAGEDNEDCYYNLFIKHSRNCVDCTFCYYSTLCYECIQCYNSYNCRHSQYLEDCSDCAFCYDLKGCNNCLLSVNLRNKEYYILNEPHSKEEYERKKAELRLDSSSALKQVHEIWKQNRLARGVYRDMYNINAQNCTGNNIKNSKNCAMCYNVVNCEDGAYLYDVLDAQNCRDLNYSLYKPEVSFELCSTLSLRYCCSCYASHYCANCYYCDMINNSHDCFGCIGFAMGHKEYCILNKQYLKEEYEQIVPRIIEQMQSTGEWGSFFPTILSPFCYNETVAHEYMPLTKEDVTARGWRWLDSAPESVAKQGPELPDSSAELSEDVLQQTLQCETSGKPYRVIAQELAYYQKHSIPLPRRSPDQRHRDRIALRNPRKLWVRECTGCNQTIQTSYDPKRPEKVLCEHCYLKEVY